MSDDSANTPNMVDAPDNDYWRHHDLQVIEAPDFSLFQQEAIRRIDREIGPSRPRQSDRDYYSRRIREAKDNPGAAGLHLGRALRLLSSFPMVLDTVEAWMIVERVQRMYVEAIDSDDEAHEAAQNGTNNLLPQLIGRIESALERPPTVGVLPPEALSLEDAARFLGLDVPAVENLIKTRQLAYVQVGSQRGRVIRVEDLRVFAARRRQATDEEEKKPRGRTRS